MTIITTKTTPTKTSSCNSDSPGSMTAEDILQEKRRLACCPFDARLPERQYAQRTVTDDTRAATGKERQQNKTEKNRRHGDNEDDDDRRNQTLTTSTTTGTGTAATIATTATKPGAVFIPGINTRRSVYNNDDDGDSSSEMDSSEDSEESISDIPEFPVEHAAQSSLGGGGGSGCGESVAVAIEVDEEQLPQIKAVPMVDEAKKKQVPFHRSKLFCKITLVMLISIVILGIATITIVLLDGDHESHDSVYRESRIRQEIEALVGREELETPESPYAKALTWMIHHDPMQLVPGVHSNLVQRFIMVYFYYATTAHGPWRSCNPAIGNELVFCYLKPKWFNYGVNAGLSMDDPEIPANRWLSTVHECHFAGVTCNDKMQVIELNLNGQTLSGAFPTGIVHLYYLEKIAFLSGNLSGPLPKDIAGLERLVHVTVGENKFSGKVPTEWWQSRFVYMSIGHNELSGTIPPEIMKNVTHLYANDNRFSGTIPKAIGELKNIKYLNLGGNSLGGMIPKSIASLNSLEALLLHDNHLEGQIPSEVGQLVQLGNLWLQQNLLTGTLPSELGNLKNLFDFSVRKNRQLGGRVPDAVYNLKNMAFVDFSECNFTGTISPMVGSLQDLLVFSINDNFFTGTIPVELARVNKNKFLDEEKTILVDRLFDGVEVVQVQNNNFHGTMPLDICHLHLDTLIADCAALDPVTGEVEIHCECCTKCCDAEGKCTPTNMAKEWEG